MSIRGILTAVVLSLTACVAFAGTASADDPAFRSSPASYDFGDIVLDEQYSNNYDSVTLYPTSEAEVEITGIEITGTDAAAFGFSDGGCVGAPLDPDWGCQVSLTFTPDTVGQKQAILEIASNATAGIKQVRLSSNVIEAALNAPIFAPGPSESPAIDNPDGTTTGLGSADFNGDGLADVATNNTIQAGFPYTVEMAVAFGQSDGTLTDPVSYPAGEFIGNNLLTGNFDGVDGPDIISLSGGQANVFLNDGAGVFSAAAPVVTQSSYGFVTPGDFNEDGDLDFTVTDFTTMEIFLGDGEGGFVKSGEQETGVDGDQAMGANTTIADFRGDGSNDVALTNYDGQVEIYLSDGDGTFTKGPIVRLGGCGCKNPWGISPADLNGDGRDDLSVAIFAESQVATLLAQPDGSMVISQLNTQPMSPDGYDMTPKMVTNGDLNGDGVPEMIAIGYNGDSMTVNSGLASGGGYQFGDNISMPGVEGGSYIAPSQGAIADFNGDGKNDVIIGSDFATNVLFINAGDPGQVPVPTSLDFGGVPSGYESAVETVELKNEEGLAPLIVESVADGGGTSGDFEIVDSSDCTDAPVLVGDSCTVELVFDPTGPAGSRDTTLYFNTNNSEVTQVQVPLTGTALSDETSGTVAPANLDFGSVTVGETAASPGIVLTNSGFVPLEVDTVAVEGTNAGDFTTGDGCDSAMLIEPGDTCTISTDFTPAAAGARSASIRIVSDATGGDIVVPLSGTGVARPVLVPEISVQPSSLAFTSTQVGSESAEKAVTVTSSGTAPLVLAQTTLGGTNPADFPAGTNTCSGILQPGAKCSVSFRFKPTVAGSRSAALAITSNAAGGAATVPLSGTATAKPATPAPTVTFRKKPKKKYVIRSKKLKQVKIAFRSNQSGSKFQCRIDGRKFSACKSPKVFRNIKPGKHVIRVRAKKAGKTGPAKVVKFRVVRKR